ncbi:hypothetical protein L596_005550 [Steinernema carpocapsae]|uniref:Protein kinase domain-containing protein n=1 Tax=Steinernema carpocapsae TaxID=34508 RepID=A0A4U8V4B9_STECR|nr:hypothetical protein L596_005550 [Steinernema carpocapsae]
MSRYEDTLKAGSHPNIIGLRGVSEDMEKFLVVTDNFSHPDLQSVLRESRAVSHDSSSNANASLLSAERLFSMMTGVAHGTGHLIKQGINHPLLASCNVLVTERGLVRIAGFGLANHQHLHGSMHNPRPSPIRWQAPECFEPEFTKATGQSLIWSRCPRLGNHLPRSNSLRQ